MTETTKLMAARISAAARVLCRVTCPLSRRCQPCSPPSGAYALAVRVVEAADIAGAEWHIHNQRARADGK